MNLLSTYLWGIPAFIAIFAALFHIVDPEDKRNGWYALLAAVLWPLMVPMAVGFIVGDKFRK